MEMISGVSVIFTIVKLCVCIWLLWHLFKAVKYLIMMFKFFGLLGGLTHIVSFFVLITGSFYLVNYTIDFEKNIIFGFLGLVVIYVEFMLSEFLGMRVAKAIGRYEEP